MVGQEIKFGGQTFRIATDREGRQGFWITRRGERVFVVVGRLDTRAARLPGKVAASWAGEIPKVTGGVDEFEKRFGVSAALVTMEGTEVVGKSKEEFSPSGMAQALGIVGAAVDMLPGKARDVVSRVFLVDNRGYSSFIRSQSGVGRYTVAWYNVLTGDMFFPMFVLGTSANPPLVLHEIGHAVNGSAAVSSGFRGAMENNFASLKASEAFYDVRSGRGYVPRMLRSFVPSKYAMASSDEYFAECFAKYCADSSGMKRSMPGVHGLFAEEFGELRKK